MGNYKGIKAKESELKIQWGNIKNKEGLYAVKGDEISPKDLDLINNIFNKKRIVAKKPVLSFINELEARGYDLETMKFAIQKRKAQK